MEASIIILAVALVGSFLMSGTEAAMLYVSKIRIRHLAAAGSARAEAVNSIHAQPEKFFGVILLLNNIFNVILASVTTKLAGDLLGASATTTTIAVVIVTIITVLFGELTPKTLATQMSEKWSLTAGPVINVLMMLLGPLVWVFSLAPRGINRAMGRKRSIAAPVVTEGELRMLIDMGEAEGTVASAQGEMLENIFKFGETEVREVMTPRPEVVWVRAGTTYRQFLDLYKEHVHTRFPVYEDDYDDVVGVLSIKDVLASIAGGQMDQSRSITGLMRRALFVPESNRLDDLFATMQQSGHKIALAVDEFGSIAGLITLTKVLEQIVGRTGEEGRRPERRFITVNENTYVVDGGMTVDEANDELGLSIPDGDYETVAGFFLDLAQRIPEVGARARYGDLRLQVASMEDKKITSVRIRRTPKIIAAVEVGARAGEG